MTSVHQRGFTLIELLVVIAIIGIISTIVIVEMRGARLKSADAAVRQQAVQLRNVMEQERTNSGTYASIKNGGGWKAAGAVCTAASFSGQFATRAAEICTELVRDASTGSSATTGCGSTCVFFQTVSPINVSDRYSILAYLPYASSIAGSARYLCIGSSGNQSVSAGAPWSEDGCQANP